MPEINVDLVDDNQTIEVPINAIFGTGIERIETTHTSTGDGDPNIITIYLTNDTHYSFAVYNGVNGRDGVDGTNGTNGTNGQDGYSPTVVVTDITGGHQVTITDVNGPHTFDVMDGTGGGGSSDYDDLTDKPSINSVTLSGNQTTSQLGIYDIYWATYNSTTSANIEAAYQAGKEVCVIYDSKVYTLRYRSSATNHRFICFYGGKQYELDCQSDVWMPGATMTFLTSAPVSSVNGQTGAVSLTYSDVSALHGNTKGVFYGTSSTAANTAEKAVACASFTASDRSQGAIVFVMFSHTNSASVDDIKLNVSSTGAKPIRMLINGTWAKLPKAGYLQAAVIYPFWYDGDYWILIDNYVPVTSVNGQTGAVTIGNATTSAAGLMSATDKSHLDDVYADYSSALTALGV
jgi:hypothetical protein